MPATARAMIFDARLRQFLIDFGFDAALDRIEKTRPAGAAVEFCSGIEQFKPASGANEFSGAILIQQRTGKRAFGTLLAQHVELFLGQHAFPPLIRCGISFYRWRRPTRQPPPKARLSISDLLIRARIWKRNRISPYITASSLFQGSHTGGDRGIPLRFQAQKAPQCFVLYYKYFPLSFFASWTRNN